MMWHYLMGQTWSTIIYHWPLKIKVNSIVPFSNVAQISQRQKLSKKRFFVDNSTKYFQIQSIENVLKSTLNSLRWVRMYDKTYTKHIWYGLNVFYQRNICYLNQNIIPFSIYLKSFLFYILFKKYSSFSLGVFHIWPTYTKIFLFLLPLFTPHVQKFPLIIML